MDPIIRLAVSIAEGRGTYAFLLGSGISKGAGVPTGQEILRDTLSAVFRLLHSDKKVSDKEFEQWLQKSKYKDYTFPQILAELCQNVEERRQYLGKYFLGKEPSQAHRILANLVKNGFIKVILTTNFDDLLEKALNEVGASFDVIVEGRDLKSVRPREHSPCRILKLHGDWRELNIRVTPSELERLERAFEREFREIWRRYGLAVVGYGGADKSVMDCLSKPKSPYGFYWLAKGPVIKAVDQLLSQQSGSLINRDSADTFFRELELKIRIFLEPPAVDTPEMVAAQARELLRDNDEIGIKELIKRHYKLLQNEMRKHVEERAKGDEETMQPYELLQRLKNVLDRLIAIGMVLIEHNNVGLFKYLAQCLQEVARTPQLGNTDAFRAIPAVLFQDALYIWGSWSLKQRKLFCVTILLNLHLTRPGEVIPEKFWKLSHEQSVYFFHHHVKALSDLVQRYAQIPFFMESFDSAESFHRSFSQFHFLLTLLGVKESFPVQWYISTQDIPYLLASFVCELNVDNEFSEEIADAVLSESKDSFLQNIIPRMHKIHELEAQFNSLRASEFQRIIQQLVSTGIK